MMDSGALQRLIEVAQQAADPEKKVVVIDGIHYSTTKLERVVPTSPTAKPLMFHTLEGLVDFFKDGHGSAEGGSDAAEGLFHIESPAEVSIRGPLFGEARQRETFATSVFEAEAHPFGMLLEIDSAIVCLKTRCVDTPDTRALVSVLGKVTDEEIRDFSDDGISQQVNVKVGVSLKGTAPVPSPVVLRPFRTFSEIEQPASPFVVRLRGRNADDGRPKVSLFEADGGRWRLEAIRSIAAYLRAQLGPDVYIIG
jgi:hypothetical protein